jgi:phage tail-like protein
MAAETDLTNEGMVGFQFGLEVEETIIGYFSEVNNLGSETEIRMADGTDAHGTPIIVKTPGRLMWLDIMLGRGVTADMELSNWRRLVEDGNVGAARKNGSIIMYDHAMEEKVRWQFTNAWPSKLTAFSSKSDSGDSVVEELVLVVEEITRVM